MADNSGWKQSGATLSHPEHGTIYRNIGGDYEAKHPQGGAGAFGGWANAGIHSSLEDAKNHLEKLTMEKKSEVKKADPSAQAEKEAKQMMGQAGTLDFSDMEEMAMPGIAPEMKPEKKAPKANKKVKKSDPTAHAEKEAQKLIGQAGTLDFSDMEEMAIPLESPRSKEKQIAMEASKRKAPKANAPVKAAKKSYPLDDNTRGLVKSKIADMRSRNAAAQGVAPAAGPVPNVDQDRMTGLKTPKPLASAPKANAAVKPAAPAAAAPAPGATAAPKANAAVKPAGPKKPSSAQLLANAKPSPYGKVIVKGELFKEENDIEKARVDEDKSADQKAQARADRNVRTSANAMSAAGRPLRSVTSRMDRHNEIKEGSPGRKGEKIAGTPKEQSEAFSGVHIRGGTYAKDKDKAGGDNSIAPMSAKGGNKSYRSGGQYHIPHYGPRHAHSDVMGAQQSIKPKLDKGELFEKSSQSAEVKSARGKAARAEKQNRGIPDFVPNPDGKSITLNRPHGGHAFGINQQAKHRPDGVSNMGVKVREPADYLTTAKEDAQWKLDQLKSAPKPNLPKSERMLKGELFKDDEKLKEKMVAQQVDKAEVGPNVGLELKEKAKTTLKKRKEKKKK